MCKHEQLADVNIEGYKLGCKWLVAAEVCDGTCNLSETAIPSETGQTRREGLRKRRSYFECKLYWVSIECLKPSENQAYVVANGYYRNRYTENTGKAANTRQLHTESIAEIQHVTIIRTLRYSILLHSPPARKCCVPTAVKYKRTHQGKVHKRCRAKQ
jgi:hypothetical protein